MNEQQNELKNKIKLLIDAMEITNNLEYILSMVEYLLTEESTS